MEGHNEAKKASQIARGWQRILICIQKREYKCLREQYHVYVYISSVQVCSREA